MAATVTHVKEMFLALSLTASRGSAANGSDNRKSPPKKVLLIGRVIWAEGAHAFDLSVTGARVSLNKPAACQKMCSPRHPKPHAYQAVVVSERANGLGLNFLRTLKLADVMAPELRFLKRLWIKAAR
jgi:hypothetical protein